MTYEEFWEKEKNGAEGDELAFGLRAWNAALEEAAKIADVTDFRVVDFGPSEQGKIFSGVTTFDNRGHQTPERIAAAIRSLKS